MLLESDNSYCNMPVVVRSLCALGATCYANTSWRRYVLELLFAFTVCNDFKSGSPYGKSVLLHIIA